MINHLNVFNPFRNKTNYHEDELTRAFLIVLKNIPIAQSAFIDMIREEMARMGCDLILPSFSEVEAKMRSIETQITHHNKLFEEMGGRRLISIIISDKKLYADKEVTPSSRGARYDGVLVYDPSWLLIIENKPDINNIWLEQLDPNVAEDIEIEEKPVSLSWSSIITRLSSLVEKDYIDGLEKVLLEDFFEFIDKEFPQLNPFYKFAVCKDNKYLLTKRCISIWSKYRWGK